MRGQRVQGKSAKRLCNFGIRSGSERLRSAARPLTAVLTLLARQGPIAAAWPRAGAQHLTELLLARRIRLYN